MVKNILALVQSQDHCALATSGQALSGQEAGEQAKGAAPHLSLMAFCPGPGCREFWLATLVGTQKHRNLMGNPRASLLLDDRAPFGQSGGQRGGVCGRPGQALTITAELAPFASAQDEAGARRALLARHPDLAGFLALDGVVVLRFFALRFQYLQGPTQVFEGDAQKMLDDWEGKA